MIRVTLTHSLTLTHTLALPCRALLCCALQEIASGVHKLSFRHPDKEAVIMRELKVGSLCYHCICRVSASLCCTCCCSWGLLVEWTVITGGGD